MSKTDFKLNLWIFVLIPLAGIAVVALIIVSHAQGATTWSQDNQAASRWSTFHETDLKTWAKTTGLSIATIQKLIRSVRRGENADDQFSIQKIDTVSFMKRSQVFMALTDFGTGHRLTVYVVSTASSPYKKVWEASGLSEMGSCPAVDSITQSVVGRATASASSDGEILVKIPHSMIPTNSVTEMEKTAELLVAKYDWNGKTFALSGVQVFAGYRWVGRDWEPIPPSTDRVCE